MNRQRSLCRFHTHPQETTFASYAPRPGPYTNESSSCERLEITNKTPKPQKTNPNLKPATAAAAPTKTTMARKKLNLILSLDPFLLRIPVARTKTSGCAHGWCKHGTKSRAPRNSRGAVVRGFRKRTEIPTERRARQRTNPLGRKAAPEIERTIKSSCDLGQTSASLQTLYTAQDFKDWAEMEADVLGPQRPVPPWPL